ncbi:TetR/AcrR family transcriptional regulator [Nitrospirillum sp. BR 11163]|uniref:TetR/AcrR family transcriptional regulator n=1 Tax=Nitrospirillum sp. BR 11163 TaxID=3104323 RepID=UPI002AFF44FA|nr:TetR/AcrR family transcriptional regulator [Nitrospirillum sp. BR 11163]MEA1676834.1 TetR/AcrR family transcriptional regulator [Nitrospirillum sp. BR 11163]
MSGPTQITDKRVERSKAKVLAETYRQLVQSGIAGVSIDEISRISGISKTTIYRHWPSRSALLIDACSRLGGAPVAPDTGGLRSDARALLSHLAHQLRTANWSSVYPSIIDAAERDAEICAMQAALHKAFMAPFEAVIERAKAKGEIPRDRVTSDIVALLAGPFFFRRWFAKEEMDDHFIDAVIDAAIR